MSKKVIIQIPCFNEELTLPATLRDLPRSLPGVDVIEIQIVDDGSTDGTVEVAKKLGVHHIVSFPTNRGLAAAFKAGAENALALGADILVNTDADNQYFGGDIEKLVEPILQHRADIVIGCRPIIEHPEFSAAKKFLQLIGSAVLRGASQTQVRDAASGFRAYSRSSLMKLNIYSKFSYCMETLIQAGLLSLKVASVDIRVNPKTRESRLFKTIGGYVYKSGMTIVSILLIYRSKTFFLFMGFGSFLFSLALLVRYLVLINYYGGSPTNFWPSIILAGVFFALSIQFVLTGISTSLIAANRQLLEEVLFRMKNETYSNLREKTNSNYHVNESNGRP